jgi:uncharacterized protein HemY
MLHKDYLLEVIAQFVDAVTEALGLARKRHDPEAAQEAEEAVAGLLDLDADVALRLSPNSLVTMMHLSGVGDSLAEYVTYTLRELGDVYEELGDQETAQLRRQQALTVASSFDVDPDVVPEEFQRD